MCPPGLPMHFVQHSSVSRDIVCCSCAFACCCTRKCCICSDVAPCCTVHSGGEEFGSERRQAMTAGAVKAGGQLAPLCLSNHAHLGSLRTLCKLATPQTRLLAHLRTVSCCRANPETCSVCCDGRRRKVASYCGAQRALRQRGARCTSAKTACNNTIGSSFEDLNCFDGHRVDRFQSAAAQWCSRSRSQTTRPPSCCAWSLQLVAWMKRWTSQLETWRMSSLQQPMAAKLLAHTPRVVISRA